MTNMLAGFALYTERELTPGERTMTVPPGTRLYRYERVLHGWRVWIATNDFIHGTYLMLYDDGSVLNVTVRRDEGDEIFQARPSDDQIRRRK